MNVGTDDVQRLHERGWLEADAVGGDGSPYFHPFRLYPLHGVLNQCRLNVAPTSSINRETFLDFLTDVVEKWMPTLDTVTETARRMNDMVTLPLLLEPLYWPDITGRIVQRGFGQEVEYAAQLEEYRTQVQALVDGLDVDEWQHEHERLRFDAASLDDNDELYLLLRVAPWQRRERLKGMISAALWIRHMAEVLRRGFEEVHEVEWLEEDQAYGQWLDGWRAKTYGAERPLDSVTAAKPYLAFEFGLHRGSVVRWYVEGETEYAAVAEVLPGAPVGGIEIINLKGSLSTKPSVPMKLSDGLAQDRQLRRFSVISFDLDEPNTVRTVRQQVKQGNVVGYIAAHDPDFEFANFSIQELVDLAAQLDEEEGHPGEPVRSATWADVTNGRIFEQRYRETSLRGRGLKGVAWGRALARHAMTHPVGPGGDRRPFIKTIEAVLQSRIVHYDHHKFAYAIDADTFALARATEPGELW